MMDGKPEIPAVGRSAMLNSAARLVWLSNTPQDHVKRSVALYLIKTQAEDSDLPPHAPLQKLTEVSGLKAAQLLKALQGEAIFGVLPCVPGAGSDANSVIYLNAETLITRVYKEPGDLIPFPTAGPTSCSGGATTKSSSALQPPSKQGTTKAPKPAAVPPRKAVNKRGRVYIADNIQLTSSSAAGQHARTAHNGLLPARVPVSARAPVTQDPAGSAGTSATVCSIPPMAVPSAIDPRLAEYGLPTDNNLGQLQGNQPSLSPSGLPAGIMPTLMPSFWPVMTGPAYLPSSTLPQYALHPGMPPSAYAALASLAGADQAAMLQQEYLRLLSSRQHQLHIVPAGFLADSALPTPSQALAAACSRDAQRSSESSIHTADSMEGDLMSLLLPAGMAAAGAAGIATRLSATETVHATAGTVAPASTVAPNEVLQCSKDTNRCAMIDAPESEPGSPRPITHMLSSCMLPKTQHGGNSKAATGCVLHHKAGWGSPADTQDDTLRRRCTPVVLSAGRLTVITSVGDDTAEDGQEGGKEGRGPQPPAPSEPEL